MRSACFLRSSPPGVVRATVLSSHAHLPHGRECRVRTEVAVANPPKVCRAAAEGVLSPGSRICTRNLAPLSGRSSNPAVCRWTGSHRDFGPVPLSLATCRLAPPSRVAFDCGSGGSGGSQAQRFWGGFTACEIYLSGHNRPVLMRRRNRPARLDGKATSRARVWPWRSKRRDPR